MGLHNYRIVDRATKGILAVGFGTRAAARQAKRELEFKACQEANSENRRPVYAVETDVEHSKGAGIYLH